MTRIKSLALKEGEGSWKEAASQVGLSLGPRQGDPMVEGRRGGGEGEGTSAAPQAPAQLTPCKARLVGEGEREQGVESGLEGGAGGVVSRGTTENEHQPLLQ